MIEQKEMTSACDTGHSEKPSKTRPIVTDDGSDCKVFARLKAQAAMIGQTLIKVPSGYLVSRWSMVRHCSTLDEVQATLKRMGARL